MARQPKTLAIIPTERIESAILVIRRQKVMLGKEKGKPGPAFNDLRGRGGEWLRAWGP
jgi:hypothetical protein